MKDSPVLKDEESPKTSMSPGDNNSSFETENEHLNENGTRYIVQLNEQKKVNISSIIEKMENLESSLNDLDKKYLKQIQELEKKNFELSNQVSSLKNKIENLESESQDLKNKTSFNLSRSQEIKSIKSDSGINWCILLQNKKILTCHNNGDIKIYNSLSYSLDFEIKKLHPSAITYAVELDNGKIVTGDKIGRIKIFELTENSYEGLKEIKKHNGRINCIISLTGNRFATSSNDKRVLIWDEKNLDVINELPKHDYGVRGLIQKKNGELVSGEYYLDPTIEQSLFYHKKEVFGKLYFWDIEDNKNIRKGCVDKPCTSYNMIELNNGYLLVGSYYCFLWWPYRLYVIDSYKVKYSIYVNDPILCVNLITSETALVTTSDSIYHIDFIQEHVINRKEKIFEEGSLCCTIIFKEKNEVLVASNNFDKTNIKFFKSY